MAHSAKTALPLHPRLQISCPPPPILHLFPLHPHHRLMLLDVPLYPCFLFPLTPSGFFNGMLGGHRSKNTELLHFISSHPVDLICSQESNLNFSSAFQIPGFSALRSDRTHSRSGIFSPDATHASGGVIISVRQGLSFSELSTTSVSSLDPYSDHVGVNISLTTSPRFHSLMFMLPYSLFYDG